MSLSRNLLLFGFSALLLVGCTEVREDLGLGRNPPDEFAVVERPPLSMPPDYGLHPPRPGAPRPQAVEATAQANAALFSHSGSAQAQAPSTAEQALLAQTGAGKVDPTIRETVDHEAAQKVVASPHLVQHLLDWKDDQQPGTVVDPKAEADRIKQAKDSNQPVNQGATPIIEKQNSGWLGM